MLNAKNKPKVAIAGGTGFVGTAIRRTITWDFDIYALTRSQTLANTYEDATETNWKRCDLFSLPDLKESLKGMDYAIYLVHSMLPSSRLTQSSFMDLDLILADNFARAAELNGIKQILYIGGLVPAGDNVSSHLASRFEVEKVLSSRSTPVTSLRTGMIVGPGGSSLKIVVNLVKRLAWIPLPHWTKSITHVVSISDMLKSIVLTLGKESYFGQQFDISNGESFTYKKLLEQTAEVLRLKRKIFYAPFIPKKLACYGVRMASGGSKALVEPLIQSLSHDLQVRDNEVRDVILKAPLTYKAALRFSLDEDGAYLPNPREQSQGKDLAIIRGEKKVRSVQRIKIRKGWTIHDVVDDYFKWLEFWSFKTLKCLVDDEGNTQICINFPRIPLLKLKRVKLKREKRRALFHIVGGVLAKTEVEKKGSLEFREIIGQDFGIVAIHDFSPYLPWYLYSDTQAIAHLIVMTLYRARLSKIAARMK